MRRTLVTTRARMAAAAAFAGLVTLTATGNAGAATFGELNGASQGPVYGGTGVMGSSYAAGPYAGAPGSYCPPNCLQPGAPMAGWGSYPGPVARSAPGPVAGSVLRTGPEGVPPMNPNGTIEAPYVPPIHANPRAYLPLGAYADSPNAPLLLWSYGQMNATTDPYDAWGLSTPQMHIPWSTPMAGWTNAATWNWWRERSGALPRNW